MRCRVPVQERDSIVSHAGTMTVLEVVVVLEMSILLHCNPRLVWRTALRDR